MSQRADLIRSMNRAGVRLDDATLCADIALARLRRQRDVMVVAARRAGLSYRQIARAFGVSVGTAVRVFNQRASD